MASRRKGQRKRKSAGVGDIFEVNDRDLSPDLEAEACHNAEPDAKIARIENLDVSESRKNSEQHNLKLDDKITSVTENRGNEEKIESIEISDNSVLEMDDIRIIDGNERNPNKNEMSAESLEGTPYNKSEEIFTIDELDNSHDDVILICDSSIDLNKEASSKINCDNSLEEGEVNDIPLEEPDAKPSIKIHFSNKKIAEIYKEKFHKFIQTFTELKVHNIDDITISVLIDDNLDTIQDTILDDVLESMENTEEPANTKSGTSKKKKRKKKPHNPKEPQMFIVDANPGDETHKPAFTKYSIKFLIDDKKEEDKNEVNKPTFSSLCFNCEQEHSLKDCPHPKNYGRINANRKKHQTRNKTSRYHLEDQKYIHLQPGKVSPNLRKALGLKKHQLPSYIYQMRILGYPPGWLEEAKFVNSDLSMFDIDGNNVKNNNSKRNNGLDAEKVISFPGFNVPFEKEFEDEYKYYRVPPFCDEFGKDHMIEVFNKACHSEEDNFETEDMDLDITNDSLTDDATKDTIIKLQRRQLDFSIDSDSNNDLSISLQELQKQKDSILEEIKKSSETVPWEPSSENTNQSETDNCSPQESIKSELLIAKDNVPKEDIKTPQSSKVNGSTSKNINHVKHTVFGTPILKSNSCYQHLPNADNFTQGVSPVIDFENLPNSTGKYEQMTGVLQKVRDTLKHLHKTNT